MTESYATTLNMLNKNVKHMVSFKAEPKLTIKPPFSE